MKRFVPSEDRGKLAIVCHRISLFQQEFLLFVQILILCVRGNPLGLLKATIGLSITAFGIFGNSVAVVAVPSA